MNTYDQDGTLQPKNKLVLFLANLFPQSRRNALHLIEMEGQLTAINKAQAVIEFDMQGNILTANDNFLKVMGYSLAEVQGKHHSIFVEEAYKTSPEYKVFWEKLNRGEFEAAEFKRLGKDAKEVWIEASYNPIFDLNGCNASIYLIRFLMV